MEHFWRSVEGLATAASFRRMTALNMDVQVEPPTKKSRPATRRRAAELLATAFDEDPVIAYVRQKTSWPKPRAAIALDISIWSASRNGARVDSACKWLLDELAGRVYADDRQVKLLFARKWPAIDRTPRTEVLADSPWGDLPDPLTALPSSAAATPRVYLTAQTRSNILADLRAVGEFEERWDPFGDLPTLHTRDPFDAEMQREILLDYRSTFDPADDAQQDRHRQIGTQLDYHDQGQQQHLVDLIFSSLITNLPVDRYGLWKRVRDRLRFSPYIFDFGPIPGRGQSAAFRQHVDAVLRARRAQYPALLPLRSTSGISMLLFESLTGGKDLDNLVRETLPAVLDILRPPERDLPGWIAEEPDLASVMLEIPFIEVVAIPHELTDMEPGSLVLGLSGGMRGKSWWNLAADHVDETLRYS